MNDGDVMATPEMMWFAGRNPDGTFEDPTYGRDDWIDQAVYDYGGYLMYDITAPNAIMPVHDYKNGGIE